MQQKIINHKKLMGLSCVACGLGLFFFLSFVQFIFWGLWVVHLSKRLEFLEYCENQEKEKSIEIEVHYFFNKVINIT